MTVDDRTAALEAAILDIDAHATALAEDDDGFVAGGYLISVGCLHRALGLIGHPAPLCKLCAANDHDCKTLHIKLATSEAMYRELVEALAVKAGISLESTVDPGSPARNYELLDALGVGHLVGIGGENTTAPEPTETPTVGSSETSNA